MLSGKHLVEKSRMPVALTNCLMFIFIQYYAFVIFYIILFTSTYHAR